MKRFFLTVLATLSFASLSSADVIVTFSTSRTDPNAGTELTLNAGEVAGSLFVFVENTSATTIEGLALDFQSETPGILTASAHLIENPAGRWFASTPGALGENPLVENSNAFNFFGGFPIGGPLLHSELQLDAIGTGTTLVSAAEGASGIAVGGQRVPLSFGSATVNVVSAIPEPSSAIALLAIGGTVLVRRNRRR
ncbi:hypothetical protein Enr13x_21300 [Stieleria neptunia]|uniref:Ice-binding protein C-terminal domain-containing protein n=1 Tax=Stieleria neptunia TaxID=2527979 RepID=A0A518HN54_9BACT|nr:PEP-CTERM sorting domain-containing protein [Stieleria neptunia]QDV42285.1 hypothetical protein Enr13x_21300 [Stieleria neptunia]